MGSVVVLKTASPSEKRGLPITKPLKRFWGFKTEKRTILGLKGSQSPLHSPLQIRWRLESRKCPGVRSLAPTSPKTHTATILCALVLSRHPNIGSRPIFAFRRPLSYFHPYFFRIANTFSHYWFFHPSFTRASVKLLTDNRLFLSAVLDPPKRPDRRW